MQTNTTSNTTLEGQLRIRALTDFDFFCKTCLKIRTKSGEIKPLILNDAQKYINSQLDQQLSDTGKVRAVILKGRQQGCSTLIAARFFWKLIKSTGKKVFILTHRDDATNNLYKLVKRYYDNLPDFLKPEAGVSNAKELIFKNLDSGYAVGTAGSGNVGRSDTIQFLHGSEVAFWQNTDNLSTGIMQTVADVAGTEIILESTANGVGNFFHKTFTDPKSRFRSIFTPWFWSKEYSTDPASDESLSLEMSPDDIKFKANYDLTDGQMLWRQLKIVDFAGGDWQFKQEYPSNPQEAFESSDESSFISPAKVIDARKRAEVLSQGAPLVIGVDPATDAGRDRTAIAFRCGDTCTKIDYYVGKDTMEVAGIVSLLINQFNPAKVFIDSIGIGRGVYDRLRQIGFNQVVVDVNVARNADDTERFFNKKAEIWHRMREWIEYGKIPDNEELHMDLTASQFGFDGRNRLKMQPKKELIFSPDGADALALTFTALLPHSDLLKSNIYQTNAQINTDWNVF